MAPFFYTAAKAASPRAAFWPGWAAGFAFHGAALSWVYSTCRFAGIGRPLGLAAWGLLAGFLGLNWGLIAALGRSLAVKRRQALRPWIWACAWTAVSVLTERLTPRLGADYLSYTQYRHLSLLQIGAAAGPYALGFLIVAWNAALAQAWEIRSRRAWGPAAISAALLVGVWGYGRWELGRWPAVEPGQRVEILQPGIDQYRKWDPQFEREIVARFHGLLAAARADVPSLVVWPESAIPVMVDENGEVPMASAAARRLKAWQVVGAVSTTGGQVHNSVLLLDPRGRVAGAYHKIRLVPFGEFIPGPLKPLKPLIGYLNQLGDMTPGTADQGLWETPLGLAGATICYEAAFPGGARAAASRGAKVIFNLTNDGWYLDTAGPYQHFQTNVFRAIESRVWVVRAANSGISGVIDPWGRVVARRDLGLSGRLEAPLPAKPAAPPSFYARFGDWLGGLSVIAVLLLAAL